MQANEQHPRTSPLAVVLIAILGLVVIAPVAFLYQWMLIPTYGILYAALFGSYIGFVVVFFSKTLRFRSLPFCLILTVFLALYGVYMSWVALGFQAFDQPLRLLGPLGLYDLMKLAVADHPTIQGLFSQALIWKFWALEAGLILGLAVLTAFSEFRHRKPRSDSGADAETNGS